MEIPSKDRGDLIWKIMEVPQVRGFRKSWRFPSFQCTVKMVDDAQKTAQMPLVQFTEKLVEVTMIMQTSPGCPSITANSGDASVSGSSTSSEWETLQLCR